MLGPKIIVKISHRIWIKVLVLLFCFQSKYKTADSIEILLLGIPDKVSDKVNIIESSMDNIIVRPELWTMEKLLDICVWLGGKFIDNTPLTH